MTNALNRRQFIQLGTGSVVVVGLGGCDRRTSSRAVSEADHHLALIHISEPTRPY